MGYQWTDAEDMIIRMVYPLQGAAAAARLLISRTATAVSSRAAELNVRADYEGRRAIRRANGKRVRIRKRSPCDAKHEALQAAKRKAKAAEKAEAKAKAKAVADDDETDLFPFVRRIVPWKAELPVVRTVFDLAEAI